MSDTQPNKPEASSHKLQKADSHSGSERKGDWRIYTFWIVLAFVFAACGFLGILTFAGIAFIPTPFGWRGIPITPVAPSAQGHVITAAVSWVAGTIALVTYWLTRDQKERHHESLLEQGRNFEQARAKHERDLAEIQRMETEFAQLAKDFISDDALARINAAIGMGEIAKRLDPRFADESGKPMPDIDLNYTIEWPDEWRSLKTERNYPFYMRVAHRLAAALYMWNEEETRSQAIRVLGEMAKWAKDERTDEPLIHGLANALAEANRSSWHLLLEALTTVIVSVEDFWPDELEEQKTVLDELLGLSRLPLDTSSDQGVEAMYRKEQAVDSFLNELISGIQGKSSLTSTSQIETIALANAHVRLSALGMWATRDAFASVMKVRSIPPDLPKDPISQPLEPLTGVIPYRQQQFLKVRQRCKLDLQGIRMFYADCRSAHFEGADCSHAHFEGAHCQGAHFNATLCVKSHFEGGKFYNVNFHGSDCTSATFARADCSGSRFTEAECNWTIFTRASCIETDFEQANCKDAIFKATDCTQANFQRAECVLATFKKANCQRASFRWANCIGAHFTYALLRQCKLYRAKMGQDGNDQAVFKMREWQEADFHKYNWDYDLGEWIATAIIDEDLFEFLSGLPSE